MRTDPIHAGWTVLEDTAGRRLGRFISSERRAELFTLEAGIEPTVTAIRRELAGWCIVSGEPLGRALVAGGGRLIRHSHLLSRDLRAQPATHAPPLPGDLRPTPADRPAADLVPAFRAAFPPEHVDGPARVGKDLRAELAGVLEDGVAGPVLPCSRLAVDAGGTVRAAAIATRLQESEPPFGGPWIAECFRDRDPRYAGAGRALLEHTMLHATRDGLGTIGLAVTHGNRARELYDELGFREIFTALSVEL
jgi:GNAT superfamily N-acetyltransferase